MKNKKRKMFPLSTFIYYLLPFFIFLLPSKSFSKETLNLQQSIDIALKNNLQIKQAEAKLSLARGKIIETKSSKQPQLNLTSSYTKLSETPYFDTSKIPSSPFTFYNSTGTVAIPNPNTGILTPTPITSLPMPGLEIQKSSDYLSNALQQIGQPIDANSQGLLSQMLEGNYVMKSSSSNKQTPMADKNVYNMKLTLQQPVYTFGKIKTGIKLAQSNLQTQEMEYDKIKNNIILSVKQAYFDVLKIKSFAIVASSAVETLKEHLKVVKDFEKEGIVAGYDVLKVEVALSDAEQMLIKTENGINLAMAFFATTLGPDYEPEKIELVDEQNTKFKIEDFKLSDLIQTAYTKRPEILQLTTNTKMAENALKLAKLNNKPVLVLVGNYESKKGDKLPSTWEDSWNTSLVLNFPFFDSGNTKGKITQSKAQLEQAVLGMEQLKEGIALEVRQSYLNTKESKREIEAAEKQVQTAEEGLRIAKERYKAGIGTSVDVMDDQTALTKARTNYYTAVYDYQAAIAKLEKAIGQELDENKP